MMIWVMLFAPNDGPVREWAGKSSFMARGKVRECRSQTDSVLYSSQDSSWNVDILSPSLISPVSSLLKGRS